MRSVPGDEQVLLALANYNQELGDTAQARAYAQELVRRHPGNPGYKQLLDSLR